MKIVLWISFVVIVVGVLLYGCRQWHLHREKNNLRIPYTDSRRYNVTLNISKEKTNAQRISR